MSSARLGLAPTLSAPNSLVPTLLAPALIPSAILAAQPQAAAALSQPVGIAVIHAVPVAAVLPNKGSRTDEAAPTEPLAQALTAVRESLRLGRTETLFTGGATRGSVVVDLLGNSRVFSPAADLSAAKTEAGGSKVRLIGETSTDAELAYINPALNLLEFKIDEILKETDHPTPKDFVRSAREALARLQKDRSYIPLPAPSDWAFGTLNSVVGSVIRISEAIAAHTSTMAEFSAAYEAYMFEIRLAIMEGESQGRLYKIAMATRIKTREIIARIDAGEIIDPLKLPELQFFVATRNHWLAAIVDILMEKYPDGGASVEEEIAAAKKAYAMIKSDWRENAPSDKSFAAATRVVEKQIELNDVAYSHLGPDELPALLETVGKTLDGIIADGVKAEASVDVIADDLMSFLNATIARIQPARRQVRPRHARPGAASLTSYGAKPLPAWRQPAGKNLHR